MMVNKSCGMRAGKIETGSLGCIVSLLNPGIIQPAHSHSPHHTYTLAESRKNHSRPDFKFFPGVLCASTSVMR